MDLRRQNSQCCCWISTETPFDAQCIGHCYKPTILRSLLKENTNWSVKYAPGVMLEGGYQLHQYPPQFEMTNMKRRLRHNNSAKRLLPLIQWEHTVNRLRWKLFLIQPFHTKHLSNQRVQYYRDAAHNTLLPWHTWFSTNTWCEFYMSRDLQKTSIILSFFLCRFSVLWVFSFINMYQPNQFHGARRDTIPPLSVCKLKPNLSFIWFGAAIKYSITFITKG